MEISVQDLRRYVGSQVYIKDRSSGRLLIGELSKVSHKGTNQYGQACTLRFSWLMRFSVSRDRWVKESPRLFRVALGSFRAARIAGEIVLTPGRRDTMIIFCARDSDIFDLRSCERTWNPSFADLISTSESTDAV